MQPSESTTVLLVEDYAPSRYATGRVLRQAGFEVREAENGTEALRLARELPDLVILDVNLPDIDGFEVCRRLKADPETRPIPVLQMSAARRGLEDRVQGLEGGADAYIAQPVEGRELVATVHALLRMRRAEHEARALATELAARTVALEQQMAEARALTAHLEAARAEAEAANLTKSRFLATMSHEIRTPINAIMGYTDLLDVGVHGPLTPAQQTDVERIKSSSRHLLGLVNDILDLSKIEAGEMKIECVPTPIRGTTLPAIALVTLQAAEKQIVVEEDPSCDTDGFYVGDEDRVRQILVNLLSNAVKFTEPGGRITVRCRSVEGSVPGARLAAAGPWVGFEVEDSGIGIAPDELARVFEPFVQVDQTHTRKQGGTGLGLTISRRLAQMMGGELTAESRPGEGSRFTLWLPTPTSSAARMQPDETLPEWPSESRQVPGLAEIGHLVAENADPLVGVLADRLRNDSAAPGAQTLDRAQLEDHLATILLDIGKSLVILDEGGGEPVLMRDGSEIQRVISELHGAQRARLGWSADAVVREYDILREEVNALVAREAPARTDVDLQAALDILHRLLDRTERLSLKGLGSATAELRSLPDTPAS